MAHITAKLTSGTAVHLSNGRQSSYHFDEAQQVRLAEVAQRCPVHKTLAKGVVFSDSASFS